ncbi:MAG: hypothetical protein WD342_19645 [Verrucomicrobiales bacterium]
MTFAPADFPLAFIDPGLGFKLIVWGGALLTLIGVLKLAIWAFGEFAPGTYSKIESEKVRSLFVGKTNRLVFGLGGLVTAVLGLIFVCLGILFERLLV